MKKITTLLLAGMLTALPLLNTGCSTLRTTDPNTGEVVIDEQRLEQTAALLETAVAGGIIIALDKNPDNAAEIADYLRIVQNTIDAVIGSEDYDPNALTEAITAIPGADSAEVRLAITTGLGLYRIYLAEQVNGPIQNDVIASKLLTAFRNGIAQAIQ